jgi:hypothetical protein
VYANKYEFISVLKLGYNRKIRCKNILLIIILNKHFKKNEGSTIQSFEKKKNNPYRAGTGHHPSTKYNNKKKVNKINI